MDTNSLNKQLKNSQASFQELDLVGQVSRPLGEVARIGSSQIENGKQMYVEGLDECPFGTSKESRAYMIKMASLGVFGGSLFLLSKRRIRYSTRNMIFFYVGSSFVMDCRQNINPF